MGNVVTLEQLARDFTGLFTRRVFRLETLDYYDAANERGPYGDFLAGRPVDPAWREPWKKLVREVRASGRVMERVHVVSEPVSDYVRFSLLHGYPASVQAGEDVRVTSRRRAVDAGLPPVDFWLFDDGPAAVLDYGPGGAVWQVELLRGPFARAACQWRDAALDAAAPLGQYVAEHAIMSERTAA